MSEHLLPAEIVAVGLVTPTGLCASAAGAAVRAGISQGRKSSIINKEYERQAMHLVAEDSLEPLDPALELEGASGTHERMLRLGGPALAEAAGEACGPVPVLLALPESRPGEPDPIGPAFLQQLSVQAHVPIAEDGSATYRQGGAGALFALRDALVFLEGKQAPQVVVGGVDTFLDLRRLALLDGEDRLYGPSSRLGFIPGECAGFLLLRAASRGPRPSLSVALALARVVGVGVGFEKGHRYSTEPYRGEGLAEAFEALFKAVPPEFPKVQCVYAGFNGEEFPAKEWGVARLRNAERFASALRIEHPADCIGDGGAALGAVMLGLAAIGMSRGYRPEPCLIWSTSDRGPRAAALIQGIH